MNDPSNDGMGYVIFGGFMLGVLACAAVIGVLIFLLYKLGRFFHD